MPGRKFVSGEGYRFGFNGQEEDPDMGVVFKYRIHDARVGRFLSVDPLAPDYPWNSCYAFAENRVIDGIDLEGLEFVYAPSVPQSFKAKINTLRSESLVFDVLYTTLNNHLEANDVMLPIYFCDVCLERTAEEFGGQVRGYVDQYAREITFGSASGDRTIAEEFFHFYQMELFYGGLGRDPATRNSIELEAEAKIFDDVVIWDVIGSRGESSVDLLFSGGVVNSKSGFTGEEKIDDVVRAIVA